MHTNGTGKLCYTRYRGLDFLSGSYDKVGKLVDYDNDIGHEVMSVFRVKPVVEELLVVFLDVAGTGFLQQIVAGVHHHAQSLERFHNFLDIGDNRFLFVFLVGSHEMVGYRGINAEFHLLWVYQNKLQSVGMLLVKQ